MKVYFIDKTETYWRSFMNFFEIQETVLVPSHKNKPEIRRWLEENLGGSVVVNIHPCYSEDGKRSYTQYFFENADDATAFKLIWG